MQIQAAAPVKNEQISHFQRQLWDLIPSPPFETDDDFASSAAELVLKNNWLTAD